jgi:hypothetical protein
VKVVEIKRKCSYAAATERNPMEVEVTVFEALHFVSANVLLLNPLCLMSASPKSMFTNKGYLVFITTNIHVNGMAR